MKRLVVVGASGSGKTALASRLARLLMVPHVELDALHWEANWMEADLEIFRSRVSDALRSDAWVVDGNYSKARDLIWPFADTLIWLDYPLWFVTWRLFWRTVRRAVTRENLWNTGNRESLWIHFLSRDSLFLWLWRSHSRHRRTYPALLRLPAHAHLQVVHLRSPREAEGWLRTVKRGGCNV